MDENKKLKCFEAAIAAHRAVEAFYAVVSDNDPEKEYENMVEFFQAAGMRNVEYVYFLADGAHSLADLMLTAEYNIIGAQELKAKEDPLYRALKVITLTPHIREYLENNDPKALEQALAAIKRTENGPTNRD